MTPQLVSQTAVANGRTDQDALRRWCLEHLGECEGWLVRRRLHSAAQDALCTSRGRFGRPEAANPAPSPHPDVLSQEASLVDPPPPADSSVRSLAAALVDDLRPSRTSLEEAGIAGIEVREATGTLTPLFDGKTCELFVPDWLLASLGESLFRPSTLFPRARRTSTSWLLFQSLLLDDGPARMFSERYDVMDYSA